MKRDCSFAVPFHLFLASLHLRYLNHIRHSLLANWHGGKVDDEVAVFDVVILLEEETNIGDGLVGAHHFIVEECMHTPNQIHLSENFLVTREYKYVGVGAPAGNAITGITAERHRNER